MNHSEYNLILVRHTDVDYPQSRCYGQSNVPLSRDGEAKLSVIARHLSPYREYKLYSSPLDRCRRLACEIGQDVLLDDRLMEINFGSWEGKHWDEINETACGQAWFDDYFHVVLPEGESFEGMMERIGSFLNEITSRQEDCMIVTHSGVIRVILIFLKLLKSEDAFTLSIGYGEILRIRLCKGDERNPTMEYITPVFQTNESPEVNF